MNQNIVPSQIYPLSYSITHPLDYFSLINKLTFHNLTSTHKLPQDSNKLLGLGLKYIPIPKTIITPDMLDQATTRLE